MPGKYKSLYQYLENRYANTVVLTFAQIEDLLGFTLAIVDIGQQDSHAEPAGPDCDF